MGSAGERAMRKWALMVVSAAAVTVASYLTGLAQDRAQQPSAATGNETTGQPAQAPAEETEDELVIDEAELEALTPDRPEQYALVASKYLRVARPEAVELCLHLMRIAATRCQGELKQQALVYIALIDPHPKRAAAARAWLARIADEELLKQIAEQLQQSGPPQTVAQPDYIEELREALRAAVDQQSMAPLLGYRERSPEHAAVLARLFQLAPVVEEGLRQWQRAEGARSGAQLAKAGTKTAGRRCRTCKGTGREECPRKNCRRGTIFCPRCHGRGAITTIVQDSVVVTDPGRNVRVAVPRSRRVRVTCPRCGGRARWACTECRGRGYVGPCKRCGGTGRIGAKNAGFPGFPSQPPSTAGKLDVVLRTELGNLAQFKLDRQKHPLFVDALLGAAEPLPCSPQAYEEVLAEPRVYRRGGQWVEKP